MNIADLRFRNASLSLQATGLLGWISFTIDGDLRLDGLTLRRTVDGRIALSFPSKRDRTGRERPYIRPVGDHARRELETQVFDALGLETDLVE